jgi:hypothetical protein
VKRGYERYTEQMSEAMDKVPKPFEGSDKEDGLGQARMREDIMVLAPEMRERMQKLLAEERQ